VSGGGVLDVCRYRRERVGMCVSVPRLDKQRRVYSSQ
jgi:hypothetical protein